MTAFPSAMVLSTAASDDGPRPQVVLSSSWVGWRRPAGSGRVGGSRDVRTTAAGRHRLLGWAAVLLTLAVFLAPAGLISLRGFTGEAALVAASESAFVRADLSGPVADSEALAELTALWRNFHLVKAGFAGLLVLALVGLASMLSRQVRAAGRGRRRWSLLSAYGGVVLWLLGALTVLLANVQGAAAPFASVASLLPSGQGTGELGGVLDHLRRAVEADTPSPVGGIASELLDDFTLYHAVFAVLAAVAGGVLTPLAARAVWRRWRLRGPGRKPQPTWPVQTIAYGAAGSLFLLLSLANVSTWVHPVPALVASLGGS